MNKFNQSVAKKGHFYSIGVGPGCSELITVKAMRLIESADVIIAPRSSISKESIALKVVRPYLREGQHIYEHIYSMSKNEEQTLENWSEVAHLSKKWIEDNLSVVHITIGDPLIYSTAHYLIDRLKEFIGDEKISFIPGISAFQTIASKFGRSLVIQEGRFTLMTGSDVNRVKDALSHCETLVLYKCGKHLNALTDLIESKGLLDRTKLVCYADQDEKEVIVHDLREVRKIHPGYMATIIIYRGEAHWN